MTGLVSTGRMRAAGERRGGCFDRVRVPTPAGCDPPRSPRGRGPRTPPRCAAGDGRGDVEGRCVRHGDAALDVGERPRTNVDCRVARLHLVALSERGRRRAGHRHGGFTGRSSTGAALTTARTGRRLAGSTRQGSTAASPAIAASGKRGLRGRRADTHWEDWFVESDPRLIKLAVNDDHGDPGALRVRARR